jgi:dihydrofolate reductase
MIAMALKLTLSFSTNIFKSYDFLKFMVEIILGAVIANDDFIGYDNEIPWYSKKDLKNIGTLAKDYFIDTLGVCPVYVGRNAHALLPEEFFEGRRTYCRTNDAKYCSSNRLLFGKSINSVVEECQKDDLLYILGGQSLFKEMFLYADTLEIMKLNMPFTEGLSFPNISTLTWNLVSAQSGYNYSFRKYNRKSKRD